MWNERNRIRQRKRMIMQQSGGAGDEPRILGPAPQLMPESIVLINKPKIGPCITGLRRVVGQWAVQISRVPTLQITACRIGSLSAVGMNTFDFIVAKRLVQIDAGWKKTATPTI